jgi:hypothetical protein
MTSETHTYRDYDRSKRRNILDLQEPWNMPLCLFSGFLRHKKEKQEEEEEEEGRGERRAKKKDI